MDEMIDVMLLEEVEEGTLMCWRKKTWRDYSKLIRAGEWRLVWRLFRCDGVAEVAIASQHEPTPIGIAVDEHTIAVNMGNTRPGPFDPPAWGDAGKALAQRVNTEDVDDDHLDAANYLLSGNDDGGEQ